MAVRLTKVFGESAECGLVQQAQYDISHVRAGRLRFKRLVVAGPRRCRLAQNTWEVTAPSVAEETRAMYLAKTPVV